MEDVKTPRVINKEIFLLVALAVVAFGAFLFTRRMAVLYQHLEERIAAFWYERGEQYMHSGETGKAIQAYRKSTAAVGNDEKYVLALADALAAGNHDAEAQQLLLRLRENDPGNTEINTHLARLAEKQGSVQEAVHYYQSALYVNWAATQADQRRKLRIEFIRFLLAHKLRDQAASELLVLQSRTPDLPAAHIETAKMFAGADDPHRAFEEYAEASQLDRSNVEALTGAGETAFEAGDYAAAEQYLRAALAANPAAENTRQLLDLTETVQREDPLAAKLSPGERKQRLLTDLGLSVRRLENCPNQPSDGKAGAEIQSLKAEALAAENRFTGPSQSVDSDEVKAAVDLIFRMQQAASGYCGKPSRDDEALLLIGRQHSGEYP